MENLFELNESNSVEKQISIRVPGGDTIDIDSMISGLKSLKKISENSLKNIDESGFGKIIFKKAVPGESITLVIGIIVGTATAASYISQTILNVVKIRKELKKGIPISVKYTDDTAIVTDEKGKVTKHNKKAFEVYTSDPKIETYLNDWAKDLIEENRGGLEFSILGTDESIKLSRSDVGNLSKKIDNSKLTHSTTTDSFDETLELKTPMYKSNAMWEFYGLDGLVIKVKIHDQDFLDKINSGEIMTTGTTQIRMNLKIETTIINLGKKTITTIKYSTSKVYEVINTNSVGIEDKITV